VNDVFRHMVSLAMSKGVTGDRRKHNGKPVNTDVLRLIPWVKEIKRNQVAKLPEELQDIKLDVAAIIHRARDPLKYKRYPELKLSKENKYHVFHIQGVTYVARYR